MSTERPITMFGTLTRRYRENESGKEGADYEDSRGFEKVGTARRRYGTSTPSSTPTLKPSSSAT
jgi:hypothetical protein